MSKILDMLFALSADSGTGDVTATNTPPLDDNTKKLSTTEFLLNQFTGTGKRSLAGSGYQKLPGGLIIQWGTIASTVANGQRTITFPIAFPTGCLFAITCANTTTTTAAVAFNVVSHSATQLIAHNSGQQSSPGSYLAIGH